MAELLAERFTLAVVFAVDLAWLLPDDVDEHQRFQAERATGNLGRALFGCLEHDTANQHQWRTERVRLEQRMQAAEQGGGKRVWTTQFLDTYTPLLLTNNHGGMWIAGAEVHEDANLDRSGGRYEDGYLRSVNYRVTREGVLVASYQAEFLAHEYRVPRVIKASTNFRQDGFNTLHHFLVDYFGHDSVRESVRRAAGFALDGRLLEVGRLLSVLHRHSLIFLEGFHSPVNASAPLTRVPMTELVESRELAGILNESPWYQRYGDRYCRRLHEREFGYRGDEIYVTDRQSTVVVAERYWYGPDNVRVDGDSPRDSAEDRDPLRWYQADLLTAIEHHAARLALLTQQLEFFRRHENRRPLEAQKPAMALPVVLDARTNLNHLIESLDFTSLSRHGFTRLFAQRLRDEIGLEVALAAVQRRVQAMSDAITLKSSVTFARSGNLIQAVSMVLAVVALLVSLIALYYQG